MLDVGNGLSTVSLREKAVRLKQRLPVSPKVEVVFVTEQTYEAGWQLYASRPDKEWGVVACLSFVVMGRLKIRDALATDKHFQQAGFVRLLAD